MKEFVSHIDYLIQKHDCVIIPDFGGFVLSHEGAHFLPDGSILPPKVTIGFNPELKYNDGLLAESYMNMYSISYDAACNKVKDAVKRLNTLIGMKHPVQVGNLGKVMLDDNNRLFFTPNANLSIFHPETFGLSRVNIKKLCDLEKEVEKTKKISLFQKIFAGAGAAAAAILLFFIASTPVSEDVSTQKSSFFTDLVSANTKADLNLVKDEAGNVTDQQIKPVSKKPIEAGTTIPAENKEQNTPQPQTRPVTLEAAAPEKTDKATVKPEPEKSASITPVIKSTPVKTTEQVGGNYYVIIGSAGNNGEAQSLISKFKARGLSDLNILEADSRFRIYVASFANKGDATQYLQSFKRDNPQMHDAWVYTKR